MFGLLKEIWVIISMDNPITYYKLLQVNKVFQLDSDMMKAKFIKKTEDGIYSCYRLPNGWLHSCDDQPAVICAYGTQYWYNNGKQHRDNDQPAVIYSCGDRYWYIDGKQHRDNDLPAVLFANNTRQWYIDGKLYRSEVY